jgi:thioredoxin reductase (NADPH)
VPDLHPAPAELPVEADAVIIGAGPVGLFQAFQLGLHGIHSHIVDALPHSGGQPVELYPDKPIYDIPGTRVCTGRELAQSLLEQVAPFQPTMHLGQEVTQLETQPDGQFLLATSAGTRLLARTVFIAAGVGAFQPRALKAPGADRLEGGPLRYRLGDPAQYAGRRVVINGGEDAALDAALALAALPPPQRPAQITLLHRRDVFQAEAARVDAMRTAVAQGAISLRIGQVAGFDTAPPEHHEAADGDASPLMTAVRVLDADGQERAMPADQLLAFLGVSPRLGPVTQWGLDIERKQLRVDTESFSTSVRGIYAVGDVNTYPGKRKLILSGFHECTLAAFAAAELISGQPVHLQYTTTSPRLHALLGVATPQRD